MFMSQVFIKNFKIFLLTVISIIIGTLVWDQIEFKYNNPDEIIGYYSIFEHSPLNDNFRYIFFVGFSLLTYLISFIYFNKLTIRPVKNYFILENNFKTEKNISLAFLIIFVSIQLFFFISKEFNYNPIDLFHEGQALSGALNFKLLDKLWSNSFLITSLFVDILNANIAWYIFDIQSLSSYRYFIEILNAICFVLIFIFIFKIINGVKLKKNLKTFFFIYFACFISTLVDSNTFGYREIPVFIFLIIVYEIFYQNKNLNLNCFLLGVLPILSLLWSLDRGIFIIASYIPLILILSLSKKIKELSIIFTFFIVSILFFYVLIGKTEFDFFFSNSYDILKSSDLLNGIIHPAPFTDDLGSSRATKNLLIIIINGIILINYLIKKETNLNKNLIIFIFLYYFVALVFYKIGVTRSDGGHLKQGISLNLILLIYLITYNFLFFLDKKINLSNSKPRLIKTASFILIFLFFFLGVQSNFINNILNFKSRLINYVNSEDQIYISKPEKNLIEQLRLLTKNEKCFQVFSYETAISYFLNKPSCTKFYHIMNMGPKRNQFIFIKELEVSNPKYILIGGNYESIGNSKGRNEVELTPKNRFPYIYKYINENYRTFKKVDNWKILIQNYNK